MESQSLLQWQHDYRFQSITVLMRHGADYSGAGHVLESEVDGGGPRAGDQGAPASWVGLWFAGRSRRKEHYRALLWRKRGNRAKGVVIRDVEGGGVAKIADTRRTCVVIMQRVQRRVVTGETADGAGHGTHRQQGHLSPCQCGKQTDCESIPIATEIDDMICHRQAPGERCHVRGEVCRRGSSCSRAIDGVGGAGMAMYRQK